MKEIVNKIYPVDCLDGLKALPDNSVQCCVTSPPYWGLRDYGVAGQLGLEDTPEDYVKALAEIFCEVKRVLKHDGTLWLNLGDAYWGSGKAGKNPEYLKRHKEFNKTSKQPSRFGRPTLGKHPEIKSKDLIGLPWMVAFALRQQGWYLRQDIIWHKPNPMPESIRDRCTKSHEYLFLLSKTAQYYFDQMAIKVPLKESSKKRLSQDVSSQQGSYRVPGKSNGPMRAVGQYIGGKKHTSTDGPEAKFFITRNSNGQPWKNADGLCNKRSVWVITTKPFKGAHFATFPEELAANCIKAGSKEGDIILDPFMGAGTTALVAARLNRHYVGFELNPDYIKIAEDRILKDNAKSKRQANGNRKLLYQKRGNRKT